MNTQELAAPDAGCSLSASTSPVRRGFLLERALSEVARISLTRGYECLIDAEDLDCVLALGRWHTHKISDRHIYAAHSGVNEQGRKHTVLLHRIVTRAARGMMVDHLNGNTLDNRKHNLRICTHAENMRNLAGALPTSLTGVRGVSPMGRKFRARITLGDKNIHLGTFDTIAEAQDARINAEQIHWSQEDRFRQLATELPVGVRPPLRASQPGRSLSPSGAVRAPIAAMTGLEG